MRKGPAALERNVAASAIEARPLGRARGRPFLASAVLAVILGVLVLPPLWSVISASVVNPDVPAGASRVTLRYFADVIGGRYGAEGFSVVTAEGAWR